MYTHTHRHAASRDALFSPSLRATCILISNIRYRVPTHQCAHEPVENDASSSEMDRSIRGTIPSRLFRSFACRRREGGDFRPLNHRHLDDFLGRFFLSEFDITYCNKCIDRHVVDTFVTGVEINWSPGDEIASKVLLKQRRELRHVLSFRISKRYTLVENFSKRSDFKIIIFLS